MLISLNPNQRMTKNLSMPDHRLIGIVASLGLVLIAVLVLFTFIMEIYYAAGLYVLLIIVSVYFLLPLLFRCSPFIQRHIIFMHMCRLSYGKRYFEPIRHNIDGGRNFYLAPQPGTKLGVWHILPKSVVSKRIPETDSDWSLCLKKSGCPVIIYFHGNMGTRASGHRLDLYRLLQKNDFHVIAFDYRGFGDSASSEPPSETGLVADSTCVYQWVHEILGENTEVPVYLWGHSLGTGVSVHLSSRLCTMGNVPSPTGLILEAPFTKMGDAVESTISSIVYRHLPGRKWFLVSPLHANDMAFESDLHIQNVDIPTLILHDKSDVVVPYKLGKQLYEVARESRLEGSKTVFMKTFSSKRKDSAHLFIWKEPDLITILNEFIRAAK